MGKTRVKREGMPSFPCSPSSSSSSSSDFEFTVSLSPSSRRSPSKLCPADELFYKGQLLPLHLSPRISMVRTLLLTSSSISSDTNTTASRDSNGSSSSISSGVSADLMLLVPDCDSPRPSSATEEEARKAISSNKKNNYFASLANRFSSVFLLTRGGSKKDIASFDAVDFKNSNASGRRRRRTTTTTTTNSSAKQVIKKYVEKVKPLYEKLKNQNQNVVQPPQKKKATLFSFSIRRETMKRQEDEELRGMYSHSNSFSGNLRFPRRKRSVSSCPSSMRSSPTHSGLLTVGGGGGSFTTTGHTPILAASASLSSSSLSSMEELQSAIQGAIAHCKSTMAQ